MNYEKAYDYWLDQAAKISHKFKCVRGRQITCSKHNTYPARMLMKLKRLKFKDRFRSKNQHSQGQPTENNP